jgi:hypothetical protein
LEARIAEHQLQSSELQRSQKRGQFIRVIGFIHSLSSHCSDNLQNLISDEVEALVDDI